MVFCRLSPTLDLTDVPSSRDTRFTVYGMAETEKEKGHFHHLILTAHSQCELTSLTLTWTTPLRQCLSSFSPDPLGPLVQSRCTCSPYLESSEFWVTSLKAECYVNVSEFFYVSLYCSTDLFTTGDTQRCLHHTSRYKPRAWLHVWPLRTFQSAPGAQ